MKRIEKLRIMASENKICLDEFFYRFYKNYTDSQKPSKEERYADAFYFTLSNMTPSISDGELIVGKCDYGLSAAETEEWQNIYSSIAQDAQLKAGAGQDSHMSIDYDLVLNQGLNGIIEKINQYLTNCDETKKAFYQTCKKCLEAVIMLSERYANVAKDLAIKATDKERQKELKKLAEICQKVPANPAENFYEAIQSIHFITFCLSFNPFRPNFQQFQLGHPDRYLLPYYIKDIQNGIITKEYAQLLLDCLGIQINNRVPNGFSSGYMVGGRDENNNIVENELTIMCMQVVDDIRLVYPAVGLCYAEGMDDKYIEKACEIIYHGRSHPAIFNDDVIIKGLQCYGVPEKEARNYIHSTCVEITPVASSNVWVASPYTNMVQILLDILDAEYPDFDGMMDTFYKKLDFMIKDHFEILNARRKVRNDNSMNPLLSCFINDCLATGIDIEQGGARYNWIMPSFVGLANLVDSLYALKTVVFEQNKLDIKEFKAILDNDFEGEELFRQYLLNSIPKYGNDIDEIDGLYSKITEHIVTECKKHKGMHQNGDLIPSVFCFKIHELFGRKTGATPDGRKKGFPLGDGSGPCQGRESNGPTASILSSTKWSHHEFIGGIAVNMKFSKKSLGTNSISTMKNLVKTYLKRGGFEIQINIVDRETLEKAITNPEEYKDLVVRIGGYSDYFVKLSPQMQQELILRTEHTI